MKYIHSQESLSIPDNVSVHIKSRIISISGPRGNRSLLRSFALFKTERNPGKLVKDMSHLSNVATLRTVKSIINNLIIGVTKGFKYKMRYVYAHFPINVNIEKDSETGLYEVDIRYGWEQKAGSGDYMD
ncbi:MAG: hypothetical protein Q9190_004156 [Brigantiaea leucoxantha]